MLRPPRLILPGLVAMALVGAMATPAWASTWAVPANAGSVGEGQSLAAPSPPGSPAAACTSATSNTIKVTWSAVTHASSYSVYDATSAATGPYSLVASGVTSTSWTSAGLATGNYWFEVSALEGSNWQSAKSAATGESTVTNSGITKQCVQP
jgi:cellulose 1,4-beta-cellobiosidase